MVDRAFRDADDLSVSLVCAWANAPCAQAAQSCSLRLFGSDTCDFDPEEPSVSRPAVRRGAAATLTARDITAPDVDRVRTPPPDTRDPARFAD